jgi:uncharacterized protein YfaS (alpha-2-macroglobulin family)
MKRSNAIRLTVLALFFSAAGWLLAATAPQPPLAQQWKAVDEAVNKGLPKTAMEKLEPIIAECLKNKDYPQAIKAIGRKIALQGTVEGNHPEEKIVRLEAEIAKSPAEMKPMLEVILSDWYWQYFQHNRWRFMQRTATATAPGKDFTTWDLPRLFAEIDKHFTISLSAADQLKRIPIEQYDSLLDKGTMPDRYRPTLYDFVAHSALDFYSSGEQAGAKAENEFELSADSPIFMGRAEFMAWQPLRGQAANDASDSPLLKAIKLYQDLLRFHQNDDDKSALLDADLDRLVFAYNQAQGEEKATLYKASLQRFVKGWGDHELSALARHHWASVLQQENSLVEAHDIAQQGAKAFPDSPGGKLCYNLVKQIEAKGLQIVTERTWNDPRPVIRVTYRNLTHVHFRLVHVAWEDRIKRNKQIEWLDEPDRKALLAQKPDYAWSADLPATEDYRDRVEDIALPKELKAGFYFLFSSGDEKFGDANNVISFTTVWVTKLAMVIRNEQGKGSIEGFILDANSGEPLAGAKIQSWSWDWNGHYNVGPTGSTDKNGYFSIVGTQQRSNMVLASHDGQQISSANQIYPYSGDFHARPSQQTIFFTDRSLYRPGQTIQYKGIAIAVDQESDNYKTLANQKLDVVFADSNGKEIARQSRASNDYGSFSGSFTAPRDRLMGQMTIRIDGPIQGVTAIHVEEYKRPKFQVELEPPKLAPKLDGDVELVGKATAYNGTPISNGKVRFHVVRQVRYPDWWYWSFWWRAPQSGSQEIMHGTAETDGDGKFTLRFKAKPDPSVPEKDEPVFQFSVSADVTDTSGETRSGDRMVQVGYTALRASLAAETWQTDAAPVEIKLTTTTLDGEPLKAEGSLKVYKLQQPEKVERPDILGQRPRPIVRGRRGITPLNKVAHSDTTPPPDLSNPNSWPLGEVAAEEGLTTDALGQAKCSVKLAPGAYRAKFVTQDRFGKQVTALLPIEVLAPEAKAFPIKIPNLVAMPKATLEPGEQFTALWGTGYTSGRAFIEIEHRGKVLQSFWTELGATQQAVKQDVTEAMRGGFTLRVTMVRENRAYLTSQQVSVPWTNKQLAVKWEHFVSKLEPGKPETWTAVVSGPDAKKAVAEMVATLYDQSLDAYLPHNWPAGFGVFRQDWSRVNDQFENSAVYLQQIHASWQVDQKSVFIMYRTLPASITADFWGFQFFARHGGRMMMAKGAANGAQEMQAEEALDMPMGAPAADAPAMLRDAAGEGRRSFGANKQDGAMDQMKRLSRDKDGDALGTDREGQGQGGGLGTGPDLSKIAARQNLNETAFFFPHLISDAEGQVKLEFTMPEALTRWKFLGFAHDRELRSGLLVDESVTSKDLMVEPNPPRFVREGDELEFTVKVSNRSATIQKGTVRLTFADIRTGKPADESFGNATTDREFSLSANESHSFSWKLTVPDYADGAITYKAVGSSGRLSDGEEGWLPVLVRRALVTESLPLPIRGPQTKTFEFRRLLQSGDSKSLQSQSLTVQMVSNPSWYAVMALPYLMEFPHECSEQTFNRLYANLLAQHIAGSDPKIHKVFEQWRGTPALNSPLEKNQDLKSVLLDETPWVRQAEAESQSRRNVGILFDDNRLKDEVARGVRKLADQQLANGAWPWFPGGPPNDYITLYITTGFGRLRHLGVKVDETAALKSLGRLDAWVNEMYREILKQGHKDDDHLSSTIALYLYGRSFYLSEKPIAPQSKEAVEYFLGQARKFWLQLACRQSQGHLALALKRFGDKDKAMEIMHSLKERSVTSEELGMFWRDTELSWSWMHAPIETQALMIEAFDEVAGDQQAVEDCKVWLLKQKQTQNWKTTKGTADAVYALLLRGSNALASDELVQVEMGGKLIQPEKVEAGTGFYEEKFTRGEVKPDLGNIMLKKVDPGVAWGSVYWQYLEDMSKVTLYDATPLKLAKSLYTRQFTAKGPVLEEVHGAVNVGDELVVRIVLRTDRDMEYVHLKDLRGSGTEPVNVLSQYKYQDGLGYYESTRDTASHFFIDYLPKGTYVFEYTTRVQQRGRYQTGFASIQCMYAPEFGGHSESLWVEAK